MSVINVQWQSRAIERICNVPEGTRCPNCHHDFDIVVSRRQLHGSRVLCAFRRYFRCRVCHHRFSIFSPQWPLKVVFRWTAPVAAAATISMLLLQA